MELLSDKLSFGQKKEIHSALAQTTLAHIERNTGLFNQRSFDPLVNPSQDLGNVHLRAVPTTPKEVDELAEAASPRLYPHIRESLLTQGALMGLLRKRRTTHAVHEHTFILNNHQLMADIAAETAAFSVAEHTLNEGRVSWQEIVTTNGIIISRGVTTLEAFSLAASEVVQKGAHSFLSFPRTKTIQKLLAHLQLPPHISFDKLVDENNQRMRDAVLEWLPAGFANIGDVVTIHPEARKRMFVSWSGSTEVVTGDDLFNPETVEIEQAHGAIIGIIKYGKVLPTVTWDRGPGKDPIFITGELTEVKNEKDISRVQEWQRRMLAQSLGLADESVVIRKHSTN